MSANHRQDPDRVEITVSDDEAKPALSGQPSGRAQKRRRGDAVDRDCEALITTEDLFRPYQQYFFEGIEEVAKVKRRRLQQQFDDQRATFHDQRSTLQAEIRCLQSRNRQLEDEKNKLAADNNELAANKVNLLASARNLYASASCPNCRGTDANITITDCGHAFCTECHTNWRSFRPDPADAYTNDHEKCPVCKQVIEYDMDLRALRPPFRQVIA